MVLDPSGRQGYAGWTLGPVEPLPEFVAAATRLCAPFGSAEQAGARLQLVDQRGPNGAMVLWVTDDSEAHCLVTGNGVQFDEQGGGSQSGDLPYVRDTFGFQDFVSTQGPPSTIAGKTPLGTEGVRLVLDDGTHVIATSRDGWFLAWWPTAARVAEAIATDGSGRVLARRGAAPGYPELPIESPAAG